MRSRTTAIALLLTIGVGLFIGVYYLRNDGLSSFDSGNRYDSENLDYMGVIYTSQSDIYAFNEGYSETDVCPWGFIHCGIDYFFDNDSVVIAAAPGQVTEISWRLNPDTTLNMYNIYVIIRFNASIYVHYCFEPFTHVEGDHLRQLAMIDVEVGDWVQKGDSIGRFLYVENGAHIHFGVLRSSEWLDPEPFFGSADHAEIMSIIHSYHPGWDLSYPEP
jgi:murein DD-endopeptidase MepM/ murein hydrolase activator NlpD